MSLASQLDLWRRGLAAEIDFWDNWLATKGSHWPDEFRERQRPDRDIEQWLTGDFDVGASVKILDVGSGPMTSLGCCFNGARSVMTACDPLAAAYSILARRHGVDRPVVTKFAFAEDLTAVFGIDEFDVTHCQRALDQTFDPVRGIEEMLAVTKVGGRVVLRHSLDGASDEGWVGLRQWNFGEEDRRFVIRGREGVTDISAHFADVADTQVSVGDGGISVFMTKTRAMKIDLSRRHRDRIQEILGAVLSSSDGVLERLAEP